ncbi:MAG: hypothetical protein RIB58_10350 [Phycisphaerales bacterium]|jgi:hypothetical protein
MSVVGSSPSHASCGAFEPLRFAEYLARVNKGEQIERAAGRRSMEAGAGEESRRPCVVPAARAGHAPRLAEVSPTDGSAQPGPVRDVPQVTIQQLLPIGSIIDVTI